MHVVKREDSCSGHLCQGNNDDSNTDVVFWLLVSDSVEICGNDTHDAKVGVTAVSVATGYNDGNKAGCWRALSCDVESPMSTLLAAGDGCNDDIRHVHPTVHGT